MNAHTHSSMQPLIGGAGQAVLRAPKADIYAMLDAQPITEGQFAAITKGFRETETDWGTEYVRDGFPWQFIRNGSRVTVVHVSGAMPDHHYLVI